MEEIFLKNKKKRTLQTTSFISESIIFLHVSSNESHLSLNSIILFDPKTISGIRREKVKDKDKLKPDKKK